MLLRVGQWLRVAGYDTVMPQVGSSDRKVIDMALQGGRWLVTRDRVIPDGKKAKPFTILLISNGLEANLRELTRLMQLDWFYRPFSRCQKCNSEFEIPSFTQCRQALPEKILNQEQHFRYCPCCQQYFWEGGHVRRMRCRLEKLQRTY